MSNDPRLLVVTALRTEWLALRDRVPGALVVRCGMGPERVQRFVEDWPDAAPPPTAMVVAGVAGGLAADVESGDVVVASEVRDSEGSVVLPGAAPLVAALRAAGLTVHHAPVLTTDHVVTGCRTELAATGAAAVDMESAPLVREALRRGMQPVAVVRVVVDTAHTPIGRFATVPAGARALATLRRIGPLLADWGQLARPRTALLAGPRSFCAGVDRAIEIVERALRTHPHPVYVRRQIVHNQHVVDDLRARGAVFVDELTDLPENLPQDTAVVLSAHGVAPAVRADAESRGLVVVDATCPLVSKVHAEAKRFVARDDTVLFIGHDHHDETEGTLGHAPGRITLVQDAAAAATVEVPDPSKVSYLMQTTLAVDEAAAVVDVLRARFPALAEPPSDDICYATTNRQQAVRTVARESDVVLVLGSANSSNSVRLVEVAEREGPPAYLVEDADSIRPEWIAGAGTVGLTAGASAPPHLVDEVVATLRALGPVEVEERVVAREDIRFSLPRSI
ncbi:4-hydroxy-3-methylbut-2-enyl diphosphate reductase [Jatrophihabitans sp. YIM 134969]